MVREAGMCYRVWSELEGVPAKPSFIQGLTNTVTMENLVPRRSKSGLTWSPFPQLGRPLLPVQAGWHSSSPPAATAAARERELPGGLAAWRCNPLLASSQDQHPSRLAAAAPPGRWSRSQPSSIRICQGCQGNCSRQHLLLPLLCCVLSIFCVVAGGRLGKGAEQEGEVGIWLSRLGSGEKRWPLRAFRRAFLQGESGGVWAWVWVCEPGSWSQHTCLWGVSGRGLEGEGALLGEGELQGLSCQEAGSICQLFAHCFPIGDLLQVLKWTGSLETSGFLELQLYKHILWVY